MEEAVDDDGQAVEVERLRRAIEAAGRVGAVVRIAPDGWIEIVPPDPTSRERAVAATASVSRRGGHPRGARGAIVDAALAVLRLTGRDVFTSQDVVDELQRQSSPYAENTIRTMISSHLCTEGILIRCGRGSFRLANNPQQLVEQRNRRNPREAPMSLLEPEDFPEVDPEYDELEIRCQLRDGTLGPPRVPWAD